MEYSRTIEKFGEIKYGKKISIWNDETTFTE